MKPPYRLALITEGALSYTPLARFPGLSRLVDQVKAPTFRLASRIANALRGARPVRTLDELRECRIYLLCAPVTEEIVSLHRDWAGRTVFVARYGSGSRDLSPLEQRGAATASLSVLDFIDGQHFLAEGSEDAVSAAVKIYSSVGATVIPAPHGAHLWLEASRFLGGTGLVGILQAATDCLRAAGLSLDEARSLVQHMTMRSLRAHDKAGHKAWKLPESAGLGRSLKMLQAQCPALHDFVRDTIAASAALHGRRPAQGFGLGGGRSRAAHAD